MVPTFQCSGKLFKFSLWNAKRINVQPSCLSCCIANRYHAIDAAVSCRQVVSQWNISMEDLSGKSPNTHALLNGKLHSHRLLIKRSLLFMKSISLLRLLNRKHLSFLIKVSSSISPYMKAEQRAATPWLHITVSNPAFFPRMP